MKLLPFLFVLLSMGVMAMVSSCAGSIAGGDTPTGQSEEEFETSDLSLFELSGRVKRVTDTTYYNVVPTADSMAIDTMAKIVTTIYFDTLGNYVRKQDERIWRDNSGRIIRWEDRRPNIKSVHPGLLKDTLTYQYDSPNVIHTSGMGDFAVTVYDDAHRVVGQYTDPLADGDHTAVFNIYRAADGRGNWTERLSVWATQSTGSRPHISYSLDRREIHYY